MAEKKSLDELVLQKSEEEEKEKKEAFDAFSAAIGKLVLPKMGGVIKGTVTEITKNAVRLDLGPFGIGVVRGEELWESMDAYIDMKVGDEVEATILELQNEDGEKELSFRKLSKSSAWEELNAKKEKGEIITVKIQSANKGGLLTTIFGISAFMPVSQLTPEHYPRVEGGEQSRILSKLQSFSGKKMRVKIISADQKEDKLIISEKAAILDQQKKRLALLKVGDIIEGIISGVVDFGAFVKFSSPRNKGEEFEGLIHISEISWSKIKDPGDILKVGGKVKAEIIGIDASKVTLSLKKLQKDPWQDEVKKYKIGQKVKGKIAKFEPFGAFVQLDPVVHGLVHISEVSDKKVKNAAEALKLGQEYEFKILSIEPEEHRLGLSIKALVEKAEKKEEKGTGVQSDTAGKKVEEAKKEEKKEKEAPVKEVKEKKTKEKKETKKNEKAKK